MPAVLRDVVEGPQAIHSGRALDLGCGMGGHAIFLALNSWQVSGLDSAGHPLRTARQRADRAGVDIQFVRGDVTRIDRTGVRGPFDFFLGGVAFTKCQRMNVVAIARALHRWHLQKRSFFSFRLAPASAVSLPEALR